MPRQAAQEDRQFTGKFEALPEIVMASAASGGSRRGPWDHSGSIETAIDMGRLLTPLKPVALA